MTSGTATATTVPVSTMVKEAVMPVKVASHR